jgi:hypothetical protein
VDLYLLALYLHLVSLVGAVTVSAILHQSVTRARRASTVAEALSAIAAIKSGPSCSAPACITVPR